MKQVLIRGLDIAYPAALVLSGILLWLPRLNGPLDLRYDAGVYYTLSTSLADGKGYRLLNEPGAIHAIQYPPLLAVFGAIHQRLAGSSDPDIVGHMLRISFFAIFLALIIAAYFLTKSFLPSGLAFLAVLATMLHVQTAWMSELFFAELPFALATVLFLLAARNAKGKSREWMAGAIAVACFLLRGSGIVVLGAWVGESLFKRQFRQMGIRAAVALVPILAWQGYIASVKSGPEYAQPAYQYQRASYQFYNVGYLENLAYVDPFTPELGKASAAGLAGRLFRNLMHMPQCLGEAVSVRSEWANQWLGRGRRLLGARGIPLFVGETPAWVNSLDVAPFLVLGILVLFGLIRLAFHSEWLLTLYAAGSCAVICLTPWPDQFERYLWPLTPMLFIALFGTLSVIKNRFDVVARERLRVPVVAVLTLLVVGVLSAELFALRKVSGLAEEASYRDRAGNQHGYRLLFYTAGWKHQDDALGWLDAHAGRNEIIISSTPHRVYIKTGLLSVLPPFEPDVAKAQWLMDSVPASYLIIDNITDNLDVSRRYAAPVVNAYPQRWELVYSSVEQDSRIYHRTNRDEEPDPSKVDQAKLP